MSGVAHHWKSYFGVVWQTGLISLLALVGHSIFHAVGQGSELASSSHVSVLESWSQWVHVKEWVFSVLHSSGWFLVQRLETLVAHSWHVHISVSSVAFNTLELSVVEVRCIDLILKLGWLNSVF